MHITRRGILLGAGAAGGLIVAWALTPRSFAPPLKPDEGEYAFDAWLKIGTDGVVTVAVPDCEMGQGITTLIPQIVAAELGADWRQVAVEPAPVSGAYANLPLAAHWSRLWMPVLPGLADGADDLLVRRFAEKEAFMVTAEGTGIMAHERPARIAAANARAMLAMAAADRWDVAWEECGAENGFILHDRKKLSFAELAEAAARYTAPDPAVVRAEPVAERSAEYPVGAALRYPRLDLPSKVDGSHTFAGDVRLPDMLFAAIRHGPRGGGALASFDIKRARGLAGFKRLVKGDNWLAAVAEDWWCAERALAMIAPTFAGGERPDTATVQNVLETALRSGDAHRIAEQGDPDHWLSGNFDLVKRYAVSPAVHATLETASATARFVDGRLDLWAASQAPQAARRAVADALGLSLDDVVLYPMPAGGSFDRRLEHDHIVEAALIARDAGRPVQLMWSRWQEQVAGLPRAPLRGVIAARTAPDGSLIALKVRVAMPATMEEFGERLFGAEPAEKARAAQDRRDDLAMAGLTPPYAIPHLVVEQVPTRIPIATARMHGGSHGHACFLIETFVDELAARSGREPLSYRMAMLGHDLKLAQCLQHAATLAEWNGGGTGSGQGLACHRMALGEREGRIAAVASARRDERGIRVDKLFVAVDVGRVINIDIARQQIEGGLLFGLGLARGATTPYADGLPLEGRLGRLGLPLLADCPDIEIEFMESDAPPFDPAELAVAVAAPAIANALHAAGGERLHALPLTAEEA